MRKSITREQLEEIEEALFLNDRETAYSLLKEYAGIEAKPYTAWTFYDCGGNWLGDSNEYTIRDVLAEADIGII